MDHIQYSIAMRKPKQPKEYLYEVLRESLSSVEIDLVINCIHDYGRQCYDAGCLNMQSYDEWLTGEVPKEVEVKQTKRKRK